MGGAWNDTWREERGGIEGASVGIWWGRVSEGGGSWEGLSRGEWGAGGWFCWTDILLLGWEGPSDWWRWEDGGGGGNGGGRVGEGGGGSAGGRGGEGGGGSTELGRGNGGGGSPKVGGGEGGGGRDAAVGKGESTGDTTVGESIPVYMWYM